MARPARVVVRYLVRTMSPSAAMAARGPSSAPPIMRSIVTCSRSIAALLRAHPRVPSRARSLGRCPACHHRHLRSSMPAMSSLLLPCNKTLRSRALLARAGSKSKWPAWANGRANARPMIGSAICGT